MPSSSVIARYACGKAMCCTLQHVDTELELGSDLFTVFMLLTGSCQVTLGGELFIAHEDDVFSVEANTPCS